MVTKVEEPTVVFLVGASARRAVRGVQRPSVCVTRLVAVVVEAEAVIHLKETLRINPRFASAHYNLTSILMRQGKVEEAGPHFSAAEQMLGPKPDPLDLANLRSDQAKRAVLLDQPAEAEGLARQALEVLGEDHPAERGVAMAILADALATQDRPEADETFKRAVELIDVHGRQVEKVDTYRAWARYLRKAGRESEALDVLDRAAQLSSSARAAGIS